MALLGGKTKDPIDVIERELSDLVARRDVVEQKFDQAHAALAAAIDVRRTSLLDADLSDEEACRRRDQLCRDTRDQVEAFADALQQLELKINAAEERLR